eukprot:PhM_4_TR15915/c1_g4_i1/m.3311
MGCATSQPTTHQSMGEDDVHHNKAVVRYQIISLDKISKYDPSNNNTHTKQQQQGRKEADEWFLLPHEHDNPAEDFPAAAVTPTVSMGWGGADDGAEEKKALETPDSSSRVSTWLHDVEAPNTTNKNDHHDDDDDITDPPRLSNNERQSTSSTTTGSCGVSRVVDTCGGVSSSSTSSSSS